MSAKQVKLYNAKFSNLFLFLFFLVDVIVVLNPLSFSAVSYNALVFSYTFLLQDEFDSHCLSCWGYHLHEWHSKVPSLKNTKVQTLNRIFYKSLISLEAACNFIKKEALAQVFCCEFSEISINTFSGCFFIVWF